MGISELLKILKPIITEKHISELKGKVAAVDMMAWIYRGVYASAVDIGQGKDSSLYLNFPLKMLALLQSYQIECIAVFDGLNLKAKESVEEIRNENKEKNLELAQKLLSEGKEEESKKIFRRALRIKSKMINTSIEILKQLGIRVVVAPYEADSQIAFLCRNGLADFAITEDSDLIPFGVNKIAFKLNNTGYFSYLDMESFRNCSLEKINDPCLRFFRKISLNHLRLVEFCVMLGCDYLPSIKGFGVKTAINLYETYEKTETVLHRMKFIEKFKKNVNDGYVDMFKKSVALFFLQTVYNPIENKLQSLNDLNVNSNSEIEKNSMETLKKYSTFCITEKENYLGDMNIINFKEFCNAELDVKTFKKEKKLETNEIIHKYVNKFKFNFKGKNSQIKELEKVEKIQNETFDELNYDVSHMYENCDQNNPNEINTNNDNNDLSENVKESRNQNQTFLINLDQKVIDEYEFEMKYCINESLKSEEKKNQIKKRSYVEKSFNNEIIEMMKIKETIKADEENEVNNPLKSFVQNENPLLKDKLTKTSEINNISSPLSKEMITPDGKEKSANKNIKSLFDILEKEKEVTFNSNCPVIVSPLKLSTQSRSILSPNFNRFASPNVDKTKISNLKLNSGNKINYHTEDFSKKKDCNTSASQCILTFSKLDDSFNKKGEQSIFTTSNTNNLRHDNIFEMKSPDKISLNPNLFMKRKHYELPLPREIKFDKEIKSGLEQKKKEMNLDSFMFKKFK